jgi:hypothetical protein
VTRNTLATVGTDVEGVADDLLEQGIATFVEPYERLIDSIERRCLARGANMRVSDTSNPLTSR